MCIYRTVLVNLLHVSIIITKAIQSTVHEISAVVTWRRTVSSLLLQCRSTAGRCSTHSPPFHKHDVPRKAVVDLHSSKMRSLCRVFDFISKHVKKGKNLSELVGNIIFIFSAICGRWSILIFCYSLLFIHKYNK